MEGQKNNNLLGWTIRLFVAFTVIGFGVSRHFYGTADATGSLLEAGLSGSSIVALVEVHVITILELIFVVCTLTCKFNRLYLVLAGVLILSYIFSFLAAYGNVSFVNAELGSLNGYSGFPLVILVLLLIIYARIQLKGFKTWAPAWSIWSMSTVLVGGYLSFFFLIYNAKPANQEFNNRGNAYKVANAKWDKYWEAIESQQPEFMDEKDYTICFFSTSCGHCNAAAKRVGVYQELYPEKKVLAVFFAKVKDQEFWKSDEVIDAFFERNHAQLPFIKIKDYEAVSLSSNEFPVIVTLKDKQPEAIYIGNELNAWAFDHLFIPR